MSAPTAAQRRNIAAIERERRKPRKGWSRIIDWTRRKPVRGRIACAVLDDDGRRCLRPAKWRITVHGNPEYDERWYAVPMCEPHQLASP